MVTLRAIHGWLSFFVGGLFLLTAATGMLYAVLTMTLLPHHYFKFLLRVHQMSIVGVSAYYVPLLALLLLSQVATGAVMLFRRLRAMRASGIALNNSRGLHASSVLVGGGAIVATLMAVSGAMYRINKTWLGRKAAASWWMVSEREKCDFSESVISFQDMHIGKMWADSPPGQFLGFDFYWPWYPLAVGLIVLGATISGLYLTGFRRRFFTLIGRVPDTSVVKV
jgi:hypothetical protein